MTVDSDRRPELSDVVKLWRTNKQKTGNPFTVDVRQKPDGTTVAVKEKADGDEVHVDIADPSKT